jgi:hypothetical protein
MQHKDMQGPKLTHHKHGLGEKKERRQLLQAAQRSGLVGDSTHRQKKQKPRGIEELIEDTLEEHFLRVVEDNALLSFPVPADFSLSKLGLSSLAQHMMAPTGSAPQLADIHVVDPSGSSLLADDGLAGGFSDDEASVPLVAAVGVSLQQGHSASAQQKGAVVSVAEANQWHTLYVRVLHSRPAEQRSVKLPPGASQGFVKGWESRAAVQFRCRTCGLGALETTCRLVPVGSGLSQIAFSSFVCQPRSAHVWILAQTSQRAIC